MIKYILVSKFREFKLIKEPFIFYILSGILSLFLVLLLIIANSIMSNFLFLVIINFLLFQYNVPFVIDTIKSKKSLHYSYSKPIWYRYIAFIYIRNNPLSIVGIIFNLAALMLALTNISLFLAIILAFLIQISIFSSKLTQNSTLKVSLFLFTILAVILNIFMVNYFLNTFLIVILSFLSFQVLNSRRFLREFLNYNNNHSRQNKRDIGFSNKNMYIKLFISYLRNIPIKNYLMILFLGLSYIILTNKISINFDFISIILFLYLFDLELIADQQFREIEKTSARYYLMYLSPLNRLESFLLTEHFHRLIIYSGLIFFITTLDPHIYPIINSVIAIILMTFIGFLYSLLTRKLVGNRKKFNNILFQYIIMVIIFSFIILKNFI